MKTASDNSRLIITPHDKVEHCQRCHYNKPLDMAVAFQRDGTATFRFLCAKCERIERSLNQPGLFKAATHATIEEAVEAIQDAAEKEWARRKAAREAQLNLFAPGAFTF